jgi:hypothetical protein
MTNPTPSPPTTPSPWRCLGGSIVSGGIASVLYNLTASIAQAFANKPISSDNFTTQRIGAAVRTLVVGLSALGTGIFALAAVGLFALGIQILLQRSKKEPDSSADS